jgi:hypothetical protein
MVGIVLDGAAPDTLVWETTVPACQRRAWVAVARKACCSWPDRACGAATAAVSRCA